MDQSQRSTPSPQSYSIIEEIFRNGALGCETWSRWKRVSAQCKEGITYLSSDIPSELFNSVMHLDPWRPLSDELVQEVHCVRAQFGQPYVWLVPHLSESTPILSPKHFSFVGETKPMARILDDNSFLQDSARKTHSISEVATHAELRAWTKVLLNTYGYGGDLEKHWFDLHRAIGFGPNQVWRHCIVHRDKEIVGSGSLFLGPYSASIANIAVHPSAQGHGIGRALIRVLSAIAAESKYSLITLFASAQAAPLYTAESFTTYGSVRIYSAS